MPNYSFELVDDEGLETQHVLPGKYAVCPRCKGEGKHDHPAFENGLTREDFDQDPDFKEEYLRGRYDVRCTECGGERVVVVVDEDACDLVQIAALRKHEVNLAEAAQERAWDRRNRSLGIEF